MCSDKTIEELNYLIGNNSLVIALDGLQSCGKEFIGYKSRLSEIESKQKKGTISVDNYTLEKNKIRDALLESISELEKKGKLANKKRILDTIKEKNQNNEEVSNKFSSLSITNKILEKMKKLEEPIYLYLEEKLRENSIYWVESNANHPQDMQSYLWWFCCRQVTLYDNIVTLLVVQDAFEFTQEFDSSLSKIRKRNKLLFSLLGEEHGNEIYFELDNFRNLLNKIKGERIISFQKQSATYELKSKIIGGLERFIGILKKYGEKSFKSVN